MDNDKLDKLLDIHLHIYFLLINQYFININIM